MGGRDKINLKTMPRYYDDYGKKIERNKKQYYKKCPQCNKIKDLRSGGVINGEIVCEDCYINLKTMSEKSFKEEDLITGKRHYFIDEKKLNGIYKIINQNKMNYEKSLASGEGIFLKDGDGNILLIGGAGKDKNGNYRCSEWSDTKEECLQNIGRYNGYTPEILENKLKNWTYAGSVVLAHGEPVEAGTKVIISENAEEECEKYNMWKGKIDEMVGRVCEVKEGFGGDYKICNKDKSGFYILPRTAFTIYCGGEEETDKMKEAMELLKENGYKIVKN